MSGSNREGIFRRTKEALQLLACSAEEQIRLLPPFVCVADELALDFSHWQEALVGNFASELTPEQIASLAAIDESFSRFSRGGSEYREEFWTDEALRRSSDWEHIRQMAIQALSHFEWPEEKPPSHAHEFVKARPTEMLKISLSNPEAGWAYARLRDGSKESLVTAPYSPDDVLRDFVDAVQSLQSAEAAECCWSQEPGELHWNLRRMDKDIEIEILKFPDVVYPCQHRGNAEIVFKARGRWGTFARQLLSSLESIKADLGSEGYARAWRHPFPREAYEKLRNAIQNEE